MTVSDGRSVVFVFAAFCTVALDRPGRLVGRSTAGDCPRTRSLPLPQGEFLTSPSIASPPSIRYRGKQDPRPKRSHEAVQKGTSNDRILWTIPNFLTMEKREKYSAAYSRTKVQGHCTGSRALFRRRSCTRTRATTNWATAVSGDGALSPLSARHALRFRSTARQLL
jgi:hypothetical protein